MIVENQISTVELLRMTPIDKEVQIKYLSNKRRALIKDYEIKLELIKEIIILFQANRTALDKSKEDAKLSVEFIEEFNGKGRVTILDKIVKECAKPYRNERDDLYYKKNILKTEIKIIEEKLFDLKVEIGRYL